MKPIDAPPLTDADRTLAAEYVLGTLDREERRAAKQRLVADPRFASLVRQWERRLAPLHELAVPVAPPARLWRMILDDLAAARASSEARPRRAAAPSEEARPVAPVEKTPPPAGAPGLLGRVGRLLGGRLRKPAAPAPADRGEGRRRAASGRPVAPRVAEPTLGGTIHAAVAAGLLAPPPRPPAPAEATPVARAVEPPPPPRPRPPPEPLKPPPAFMFLEPEPPPEASPAEEPGGPEIAATASPPGAGSEARGSAVSAAADAAPFFLLAPAPGHAPSAEAPPAGAEAAHVGEGAAAGEPAPGAAAVAAIAGPPATPAAVEPVRPAVSAAADAAPFVLLAPALLAPAPAPGHAPSAEAPPAGAEAAHVREGAAAGEPATGAGAAIAGPPATPAAPEAARPAVSAAAGAAPFVLLAPAPDHAPSAEAPPAGGEGSASGPPAAPDVATSGAGDGGPAQASSPAGTDDAGSLDGAASAAGNATAEWLAGEPAVEGAAPAGPSGPAVAPADGVPGTSGPADDPARAAAGAQPSAGEGAAEGAVAHLAAFHDVADAGASVAGVEAFAPASDAIGGEAASPLREEEPGGAATAPAAFGEAAPLTEERPWETATAEAQDTIHLATHDATGDLPADMVGEAQPLPSWAEAVASGAVSAIPELDEDLAAAKAAAADLAAAELAAARPGVAVAPGLAALRRTAFWRAAALVLAGAGLGLGGFLAYREWIAPPAGEWVAVLQAEPQPAITVRIDPVRGMLHVRAFTPLVTAGEVYRLWLVPRGQQAMLLGSFAARFAGRAPALARLGVGGLGTSEVLVTREKDPRPDPAAAGPDAADVVYRGRLYPE